MCCASPMVPNTPKPPDDCALPFRNARATRFARAFCVRRHETREKRPAAAAGGTNYIETVWGRGYVLRDPAEGVQSAAA